MKRVIVSVGFSESVYILIACTTAVASGFTSPVTVRLSEFPFFRSASNWTVWLPEYESSWVFSIFPSALSISALASLATGTGGVVAASSMVSGAAQAGAAIRAVKKQAIQSFLPNLLFSILNVSIQGIYYIYSHFLEFITSFIQYRLIFLQKLIFILIINTIKISKIIQIM